MVGEGVMDGVNVSVGVNVNVGVEVSVGVKVNVAVGVFVHVSAVAVSAVATNVACCSGEGAHADNKITIRKITRKIFILVFLYLCHPSWHLAPRRVSEIIVEVLRSATNKQESHPLSFAAN